MEPNRIVSRDEWIAARRNLLAREKELTQLRDRLSRERRALPWVKVEKTYAFDTAQGKQTLAELFGRKSQLVVYHFMFAPEWETGCKSCSFWADNFERNVVHLAHRDVALVAISRAPLAKIEAFRTRMGWTFPWVSSGEGDFNYDYGVSFRPQDGDGGTAAYNYAPKRSAMTDLPGISVFCKDADGAVFHTYSTYARGIDMMNAAYHYLDLVPKGRDEEGGHAQAWVRLRDSYAD